MQCNIQRRGMWLRVVLGVLTAIAGISLVVQITGVIFFAGLVMIAAGGFMIFEGSVGWCAARALGFSTPI
jgi:hypothetical protein